MQKSRLVQTTWSPGFNAARADRGVVPRSRNQRTPARDSCSLAPLLFEKQLPFNLFLSFISQVNQHGAV